MPNTKKVVKRRKVFPDAALWLMELQYERQPVLQDQGLAPRPAAAKNERASRGRRITIRAPRSQKPDGEAVNG